MQCKKCEKEIPATAVHCAFCGTSVVEESASTSPVSSVHGLTPARKGKRFINYIVDGILIQVVFAFLNGLKGSGIHITTGSGFIDGLVVFALYYFISEMLLSKSPAKFLTKTRVVSSTGGKPTTSSLALRTLVRFIPFEPLSILFASKARGAVGWHDRFANTLVVEDK